MVPFDAVSVSLLAAAATVLAYCLCEKELQTRRVGLKKLKP